MKRIIILFAALFCTLSGEAQYSLSRAPLKFTGGTYVPEIFALTSSKNVMWVGAPEPLGGSSKNYAITIDGGASFTKGTLPDPTNRGIVSMCALDASTAWAAMSDPTGSPTGNGSVVYKTINGGTSWSKITNTEFAAPGYINFIHFFNKDTGIVGGDANGGYWEMYTTTNGGTTWTRVPQASLPTVLAGETGTYSKFSAYSKNIWVGTTKGRVLYSNDWGKTWQVSTVDANYTTIEIEMSDAMNGVALDPYLGTDIYLTGNGGASWTAKSTGSLLLCHVSPVPGVANAYMAKVPGSGYYVTMNNFSNLTLIGSSITPNAKMLKMYDATFGWSQSSAVADSQIVVIKSAGSTDIKPISNLKALSAFPNPVIDGAAMISYNLDKTADVQITIADAMGKTVRIQKTKGNTGNNVTVIDFNNLTSGTYHLTADDGKGIATLKMIVQ